MCCWPQFCPSFFSIVNIFLIKNLHHTLHMMCHVAMVVVFGTLLQYIDLHIHNELVL